jgi:hypothetical protein
VQEALQSGNEFKYTVVFHFEGSCWQTMVRAGYKNMIPGSAEVCLSALFVDFDNVYLSLRRKSEDAAGRFARNPAEWMSRIATGGLVRFKTPQDYVRRRFAVARCYGNPGRVLVSRGGPHDPHAFATVRTNFMIAGLEVVDCQPLSSQFKNGTDIKIACDIRDFLEHPTRFGEFIILSGDADFTPVLHHLRSHDRRTVVYANESTADIYKAFSDGWIEERDMISFLLDETVPLMLPHERSAPPRAELGFDGPRTYSQSVAAQPAVPALPAQSAPAPVQADFAPAPGYGVPQESAKRRLPPAHANSAVQSLIEDFQAIGAEILNLVIEVVRSSEKPVPIAYLADRAQKILGHAKTLGTNWAGSGGFLNFLNATLPDDIRLTDKPPHFVYDPKRHRLEERTEIPPAQAIPQKLNRQPPPQPESNSSKLAELQNSITRIYDACKAPPLPPSEYQLLFTLIATEVHERGFAPVKTAQAVVARANQEGLRVAMKDVSFVLDAIDEIDPWLEHTRSPAAVARAYRDFVLAKCRHAGVQLTEDEYQLVQVWFGASQWSPAVQSAVTVNGTSHAASAPQRPQLSREARSYMAEPVLSAPDPRSDIPLPPDFGFDRELEAEPTKGIGQRFGFKH